MFVLAFVLQAERPEMGRVTAVQGACDTWGQVRKIKTFWEESPLSQSSHLLERQVDQQIWVTGIHICVCVCMCVHRNSAPGHLLWHLHNLLCPLVKQLSRMITSTVTRSRPKTHRIAALVPGGICPNQRDPSARIRMCRGMSLSALLTAKAKLLHGAWQQGGGAADCPGNTLPKPRYEAPA